ncbi:hypothetical protein P7K49_023196, partial [Saguinus oedipus]
MNERHPVESESQPSGASSCEHTQLGVEHGSSHNMGSASESRYRWTFSEASTGTHSRTSAASYGDMIRNEEALKEG